MNKRVLVACEYSGTVRDAFSILGWDAWSCDIIPTESEQTKKEDKHIQADVLTVLKDNWDLMIGHPPCNYISFAGMNVWNNPGRSFSRIEALKFFAELWEAPIPHICLENPKSCASPVIAKHSQVVQPYYFGDPQMKTTWLWLKNLPLLQHTNVLSKPAPTSIDCNGKKRYYTDSNVRDPKERAKFWPGIARAMAEQWSEYLISQMA